MTYPLVKFGDVVRQAKDKVDPQTADLERYVAGEHMETDNLHIRSWGEIGNNYLGPAFHMHFRPGQVLYGSRRTYLRKVAVAEFEGVCANTTYVLEPQDPDVLLPEFLPFVMSTERFHDHSIQQSKGSVNPYINFSDIAWYEFPLPPLDKQRRIAALLWAADDTIQEYLVLSEQLNIITKIQMDSWLSNTGFSPHWSRVSLRDVCEITSVQIDSTQQPYCDMIQIGAEAIDSGTGVLLTTRSATQQNVSGKNLLFGGQSVLYSKIRPYLKKVVFPKFAGICSVDIFPLTPKDNILPDLLFYLLISDTFTQYAISQSAGTAFPRVNRNGFLAFTFRLPPRQEQGRIVGQITDVFDTLSICNRHVANCRKLRKELLGHLIG